MTDWRQTTTERLTLEIPGKKHVDDLFTLHADPAVWAHFPYGIHESRRDTEEMVAKAAQRWTSAGLGFWAVREAPGGPVVGWAGSTAPDGSWWNLGYRFSTDVQGRGYATEASRVALDAAHDVHPEWPVLAYLLEDNSPSKAVAERVGLQFVWRGPDAGNPDPTKIRLVYADRELDEQTLAAIIAHS